MSVYYIAHHGIRGQKWGVRRWQSKDGSYNAAGEKRYGIGDGESYHKLKVGNRTLSVSKNHLGTQLKNGTKNYAYIVKNTPKIIKQRNAKAKAAKAKQEANQPKSQAKQSSKQKLTGKQKAKIALGVGAAAAGVGMMAYGAHKSNQAAQARRDAVKAIQKQTDALSAAKKAASTAKEAAKQVEPSVAKPPKVPKETIQKAVTKAASTPMKDIKDDPYGAERLSRMIDGLNKDLLIKNEKELDDFFLK